MDQVSTETTNKKYIIGGIAVFFLAVIVYFLFFRENKDEKKKKNNLYIAMKATGAIVEEYDQQEDEEKACEIMMDMIFGKNNEGGLNVIYEDVTGKKFGEERFKCKGKTYKQTTSDTKYMEKKIEEAVLAILKNSDVNKRNNDFVSILILIGYGIGRIGGQIKLNVKRDGETIKAIEFGFRKQDGTYLMMTPSLLLQKTDAKQPQSNYFSDNPEVTELRKKQKEIAIGLVNSSEISRLRSDTNSEIPVDALASIMIYQTSKLGMISLNPNL